MGWTNSAINSLQMSWKLATVSLHPLAKTSHLSWIVPPKHCRKYENLRGPVVSDKHGTAETSSNSKTQRHKVSTSWEDALGTLYFRVSLLPSPILTEHMRDTFVLSDWSLNKETKGITCQRRASLAALAVAKVASDCARWPMDDCTYNARTRVWNESWTLRWKGFDPEYGKQSEFRVKYSDDNIMFRILRGVR